MTVKRADRYPGRWEPETIEYPLGKPKNRTSATSKDGSYFEKDWISDYEGFFGALLNKAGITPNGTPDTAEASQLYDSMKSIMDGDFSSSINGYQKLPSGIIIQWAQGMASSSSVSAGLENTFPISFPNATFVVVATHKGTDPSGTNIITVSSTQSTIHLKSGFGTQVSAPYIAIGY